MPCTVNFLSPLLSEILVHCVMSTCRECACACGGGASDFVVRLIAVSELALVVAFGRSWLTCLCCYFYINSGGFYFPLRDHYFCFNDAIKGELKLVV